MIQRHTSLSKNIIQFCRFLRAKDFTIGAEEEIIALTSLQFINYNDKNVFRQALKAVLCRSQKQLAEFDNLFIQYWKELKDAVDSKLKSNQQQKNTPVTKDASFKSLKAWLGGNKSDELEEVASY